MPKFFFHVQVVDGAIEEDTIGAEFDTEQQAVREAHDFAHELRREAADAVESVEHIIEVTDEAGRSVVRLAYRATQRCDYPPRLA